MTTDNITMGYYDDPQHIEQYIAMAKDYDGRALIAVLREYLPAGASVLELGMGPGKDLLLLAETYQATGSDASALFVERFRKTHPTADLLVLDAMTLDTRRTFDAIYSNKVLQHLSREDLVQSLQAQAKRLNPGGLLLHSFWAGEGQDEMHGLLHVYYTEATLQAAVGPEFETVRLARYAEMEPDDSLLVVLRKRTSKTPQPE